MGRFRALARPLPALDEKWPAAIWGSRSAGRFPWGTAPSYDAESATYIGLRPELAARLPHACQVGATVSPRINRPPSPKRVRCGFKRSKTHDPLRSLNARLSSRFSMSLVKPVGRCARRASFVSDSIGDRETYVPRVRNGSKADTSSSLGLARRGIAAGNGSRPGLVVDGDKSEQSFGHLDSNGTAVSPCHHLDADFHGGPAHAFDFRID